jgi:hypothetical protein
MNGENLVTEPFVFFLFPTRETSIILILLGFSPLFLCSLCFTLSTKIFFEKERADG